MVKIYFLLCPFSYNVKYIGKTTQPLNRRLTGHITEAVKRNCNYPKCKWIRYLDSQNEKPIITLVEKCNSHNWEEVEKFYIKRYWDIILNSREGGAAGNYKKLSKRHRENISKALTGRKRSEKAKKAISKGHKGKKLSKSTKEKLRKINLGRKEPKNISAKKRNHKGVLQLDLEGNILNCYFSLSKAARKTGFYKGNISSACTGRLKTYKGFKWKYKK